MASARRRTPSDTDQCSGRRASYPRRLAGRASWQDAPCPAPSKTGPIHGSWPSPSFSCPKRTTPHGWRSVVLVHLLDGLDVVASGEGQGQEDAGLPGLEVIG